MAVKLCLNAIVRDEAHIISRCLTNVMHLIDAVAIVDTGSEDDTIDIINEFLEEHQIPGEVISRPWQQFGISRTEALRHAEDVIFRLARGELDKKRDVKREKIDGPLAFDEFDESFCGKYDGNGFLLEHLRNNKIGDLKGVRWYALFMDADNLVRPDGWTENSKQSNFSFNKDALTADAYSMDMRQVSHSRYGYTWLVKIDPGRRWQWYGVLHEYVGALGKWQVTKGKINGGYIQSGREGSRSKDPYKYKKDALILEKAILDEPKNERYVFYCAQSYKDARDYTKAREFYIKRAEMGGWVEETYISWLEAGKISLIIKDEDAAVKHFMRAFNVRPTRREASYFILKHMRTNNLFILGWHFAKPLVDHPYSTDILFVDESIDRWQFFFEASLCAYYAGDKSACKQLSLKALEYPHIPPESVDQIRKNISFC